MVFDCTLNIYILILILTNSDLLLHDIILTKPKRKCKISSLS